MNHVSHLFERFLSDHPRRPALRGGDSPAPGLRPPESEAGPEGRPALVIAHPGHELRIHGWLCQHRPTVFVLTDGSGRGGRSRLGTTGRVLAQAGAEPGSIFGRYPDAAVYQALLE